MYSYAGDIGGLFLLGVATGDTNAVKEVGRLVRPNNIISPSRRDSSGGRAEFYGLVADTERANEPVLLVWMYAPSRVGKGMAVSEWPEQLEKQGQAVWGSSPTYSKGGA